MPELVFNSLHTVPEGYNCLLQPTLYRAREVVLYLFKYLSRVFFSYWPACFFVCRHAFFL